MTKKIMSNLLEVGPAVLGWILRELYRQNPMSNAMDKSTEEVTPEAGLVLVCSDAENVQWWTKMCSDERLFVQWWIKKK